jgi:hypothetical protein
MRGVGEMVWRISETVWAVGSTTAALCHGVTSSDTASEKWEMGIGSAFLWNDDTSITTQHRKTHTQKNHTNKYHKIWKNLCWMLQDLLTQQYSFTQHPAAGTPHTIQLHTIQSSLLWFTSATEPSNQAKSLSKRDLTQHYFRILGDYHLVKVRVVLICQQQ